MLADPVSNAPTAERVVLVAGKLYYDLAKARAARGLDARVALVRLEELCPFPFSALAAALRAHGAAREVVWAQEEPRNMGAWTFIEPRLRSILGEGSTLDYIGRPDRASPAEGYPSAHNAEQARIVAGALETRRRPEAFATAAHAGEGKD